MAIRFSSVLPHQIHIPIGIVIVDCLGRGRANGARIPLDLKTNIEERNDNSDRANHLCEVTPVLKGHRPNEIEISHGRVLWQSH